MLQGLNLIASVAFQTNRDSVGGQCTLGDVEVHSDDVDTAFGSRAYRCLVSGSTQTGAPAAISDGQYSCILGAGNDDISVASVVIMWNANSDDGGGAGRAAFLKFVRTAPSVYEINIYTISGGGVPTITDTLPAPEGFPIQINVAWFRLDPA